MKKKREKKKDHRSLEQTPVVGVVERNAVDTYVTPRPPIFQTTGYR